MRPLVLLWGCLVLPGSGALIGPKEIKGFEGDTVSLQCTYGEKLRDNKKYWCKKTGIYIYRCSNTIYTAEGGQERTEGRVSIQDIPQKLRFKVTLRKLTLADSGEYWCGVSILGFDEASLVSLVVLPGTSRPSTHLDSTLATETGLVPSSSSSKSRVSISMVRILAPVLVLLTLLLATLLTALSTYLLRWRKKAQLATETQRNGKVNISQLPLGNGLVPENTVIRATAPPGPAASPCAEIRCLSQTSEEEEAALQDLEGEVSGEPPLALSEELKRSVFISV